MGNPGVVSSSEIKNVSQGSISMWDSFQHILLFISLYVMATSFALLLHFFIDKYVPGTLTMSLSIYSGLYGITLVRTELAALIVSFPLYTFFFLMIAKRTLTEPAIKSLKSRKFLIYLTLIVTFITVLINIISIVLSLLNGNVSLNFLLHFIDTVTISGIIFGYYLYQVREDRRPNA